MSGCRDIGIPKKVGLATDGEKAMKQCRNKELTQIPQITQIGNVRTCHADDTRRLVDDNADVLAVLR